MFAGCHALLPVTGCLAIEAVSLATRGRRFFPDWTLPVVALFGVLPDLCSPHISLDDRYDSWSHTLLFLGVLVPVCLLISTAFEKGKRLRVAVVIWLAAALHLAGDAMSGGIPWLLPWDKTPLGSTLDRTYIEPETWIYYDGTFIVLAWLGWRLRQRLEVRAYERELAEGK